MIANTSAAGEMQSDSKLTFTDLLLRASHYARSLACLTSFHPQWASHVGTTVVLVQVTDEGGQLTQGDTAWEW